MYSTTANSSLAQQQQATWIVHIKPSFSLHKNQPLF
jgi:hypothetical protein